MNNNGTNVLWYRQRAGNFDEALPLGNGRLGAMVFGDALTERISINEDTMWSGSPWYYENPGEPLTVYAEDGTWESRRLMDYDPDSRDTSDGFTFDVSRAVMSFHDHYTDDAQDAYYFQCRVKVTDLFQWAELDDIPIHDFWAVDSLGNVYSSFKNDAYSYQRSVSGNLERTGYFSCTMDLWLNNFISQDAQWIELRYDRDGRDIRLRIDLNGGEGA